MKSSRSRIPSPSAARPSSNVGAVGASNASILDWCNQESVSAQPTKASAGWPSHHQRSSGSRSVDFSCTPHFSTQDAGSVYGDDVSGMCRATQCCWLQHFTQALPNCVALAQRTPKFGSRGLPLSGARTVSTSCKHGII